MLTILLMISNVFYGLIAISVWGAIYTGQYEAKAIAPMLFLVFIFGGLFSISVFEVIRNLQKGIWR